MGEEYIVYKYNSNVNQTIEFESLLKKLKLQKGKKLDFRNREMIIKWIYHMISTCGRVKVLSLFSEMGLVHYSFICLKSIKFSFLNKRDCVIGPCWTKESFRGNKIYPTTINYIANEYKNNNVNAAVYILIRENNIESTNAVNHSGTWLPVGKIRKNTLKQYKECTWYE